MTWIFRGDLSGGSFGGIFRAHDGAELHGTVVKPRGRVLPAGIGIGVAQSAIGDVVRHMG
jgi:hypothetical protein